MDPHPRGLPPGTSAALEGRFCDSGFRGRTRAAAGRTTREALSVEGCGGDVALLQLCGVCCTDAVHDAAAGGVRAARVMGEVMGHFSIERISPRVSRDDWRFADRS